MAFVNELIQESELLEIEIPSEIFQRERLRADLQTYDVWKGETEQVLEDLETELLPKNFRTQPIEDAMDVDQEVEPRTKNLSEEVQFAFNSIKDRIKELPLYDNQLFVRIQAFDWLLSAKSLVEKGSKGTDEKFIFSLQYWENMHS